MGCTEGRWEPGFRTLPPYQLELLHLAHVGLSVSGGRIQIAFPRPGQSLSPGSGGPREASKPESPLPRSSIRRLPWPMGFMGHRERDFFSLPIPKGAVVDCRIGLKFFLSLFKCSLAVPSDTNSVLGHVTCFANETSANSMQVKA